MKVKKDKRKVMYFNRSTGEVGHGTIFGKKFKDKDGYTLVAVKPPNRDLIYLNKSDVYKSFDELVKYLDKWFHSVKPEFQFQNRTI